MVTASSDASVMSTAGSVTQKTKQRTTFVDAKYPRIEDIEKQELYSVHHNVPDKYLPYEANEEDEDIDALIDELQSVDPEDDLVEESQDTSKIPVEMLQTDPSYGLHEQEVMLRRRKYGLNLLQIERESNLKKLLRYFIGPIQFVMALAAVLAAGLQQWVDLGVIIGMLLLNAIVGFLQENHAGQIVQELRKTLALKAVVLREGRLIEIEAPMVVPGDILQLEEGIIAADGKIVSEGFVQVDQSSITGESLSFDKHKGDTCYASSVVKRGTCLMIVTATGEESFIGRTASLVNATDGANSRAHFTEVLHRIGAALLAGVVFTLLVVLISSYYRSNGIVTILKFVLGITVIGVPVGLPAVVTTTLAVGAGHLAKKKAIVQKLSAIESLAGVEVLCSDKTGTMTQNKLSLHEPFTMNGYTVNDLMLTACLACNRTRSVERMDAIDRAFFKSLRFFPEAKAELKTHRCLQFAPFDHLSRRVSAIVETPDGKTITAVKGAPLAILKLVEDHNAIPDEIEAAYKAQVAEFAARGFRSLGVACLRDDVFSLIGIVPLHDPPRHDTAETIREAKKLGLSIKMLTGDSIGISKEVSRSLGLGTNIFDAERLMGGPNSAGNDRLQGSEIADFVEASDGLGELLPQHKFAVIDVLQRRGYLVAMTGDGVNDAPSLKRADVGIAVAGSSDAARSAGDIVLLAPGLSAIIDAIRASRQVFSRMHAYIVYRIALSIHLEVFLGLWIAIQNQSLNLQLTVFLAFFADIATLPIAYDHAQYTTKPVKWHLGRIWAVSICLGLILAASSWIALTTLTVNGDDGGISQNYGDRQAVIFLSAVISQNSLILITRCQSGPFWTTPPAWPLITAIGFVDILASLFAIFGWFVDSRTDIVTVVRVWLFSIGVFCVMAGVHYMVSENTFLDRVFAIGREKPARGAAKFTRKELENFLTTLQRVSTQHEKLS